MLPASLLLHLQVVYLCRAMKVAKISWIGDYETALCTGSSEARYYRGGSTKREIENRANAPQLAARIEFCWLASLSILTKPRSLPLSWPEMLDKIWKRHKRTIARREMRTWLRLARQFRTGRKLSFSKFASLALVALDELKAKTLPD